MKILCVEDGSIDIDKIESEGLQNGKVLIYRQGANPPFVLNLDDLDQLAIYKRALELACVNVNCMDCCHFNCRKEPYNEKHNCIECKELGLTQKHLSKYFLDQAQKELEEENVENNG